MPKVWASANRSDLDPFAEQLNSSIHVDYRLASDDITGSIAHATMLGKQGIISVADSQAICSTLQVMKQQLASGELAIDFKAEDIHMFIEAELTRRIGDAGKKLHTGRSRNDQVALDLRLYCKHEINDLQNQLQTFLHGLIRLSEQHLDTIMPGYTHLQIAQPVTLAHHLLAYGWMFARDLQRLKQIEQRVDVMPLGSGALAATSYPLDRQAVADLLGFSALTYNSMDAVANRDYAIELVSALSLLMVHFSRFSEELILWNTKEFSFIEFSDEYSTGSSIMPQKKNPDCAELVRGKSSRVIGDLTTLLTLLKGLPMTYNKDLQEDKEALFDAIDTAKLTLDVFPRMLSGLTIHVDAMFKRAHQGYINATDCADYLVAKGLPFRDSYHISAQLVAVASVQHCSLDELPFTEFQKASPHFAHDIYDFIDLTACLARRNIIGGPAPEAVRQQIQALKTDCNLL